jgi:NADH-quinone oxidoreductase subunit L
MLLTVALSGLGFLIAYVSYCRQTSCPVDSPSWPAAVFTRLLLNKYYIDELYDAVIVRPFTTCSRWLARVFDPGVIDGLVNGIAKGVRGSSLIWREVQTGNVNIA